MPGASRFTSTDDKRADVIRYLREPEGLGKANIYHSLFLKEALDATLRAYPIRTGWGTDFSFNLAFLTRFDIIGTDEVLFYKRVIRRSVEDQPDAPTPIVIRNVERYTFRPRNAFGYIRECYEAARNTPYKNVVLLTMLSRIPASIINRAYRRVYSWVDSIEKRCSFLRQSGR